MATFTPYLNLEKPTTSERLDVLKINSNWDKIDAGVSALNGQIKFKQYSSVADLNLTVGSATIADTYNAMGTQSIGIFPASDFPADETPTTGTSGYVRIEKLTSARGRIFYYSKTDNSYDAEMALDSSNVPTGKWYSLGYQMKQAYYGNATSVTFDIPSNSRLLFLVAGSNSNDNCMLIMYATSSGDMGAAQVYKGNNVTINTSVQNKLTITFTQSINRFFLYMPLSASTGDITIST